MDIFLVVVKLGSIAYKLTLATSKIHLLFHVSILRPFRRDLQLYYSTNCSYKESPSSLSTGYLTHPYHQTKCSRQLLMQLERLPLEDVSWITLDDFCCTYWNFHLENKIVLEGVRNDTRERPIEAEQLQQSSQMRQPSTWNKDTCEWQKNHSSMRRMWK